MGQTTPKLSNLKQETFIISLLLCVRYLVTAQLDSPARGLPSRGQLGLNSNLVNVKTSIFSFLPIRTLGHVKGGDGGLGSIPRLPLIVVATTSELPSGRQQAPGHDPECGLVPRERRLAAWWQGGPMRARLSQRSRDGEPGPAHARPEPQLRAAPGPEAQNSESRARTRGDASQGQGTKQRPSHALVLSHPVPGAAAR